MSEKTNILVCSVGGSPEPILTSLREHEPKSIVFIVSGQTRPKVMEIMRDYRGELPSDMEIVQVSDAEDLRTCTSEIRNGIIAYLRKDEDGDGINSHIVADITGGTKPMCAALTLAMLDFDSYFSYVGGSRRTKDGVGIVENGFERVKGMDNPWKAMAYPEARDMVHAFNASQIGTACDLARALSEKVTANKKFYGGLADLIAAFRLWDNFSYKDALSRMRQGMGRLAPYDTPQLPQWQKQMEQFQKANDRLEALAADAAALTDFAQLKGPLPSDRGNAYLEDLIANAARRASLGKYDDAVARLYSAVEKTAKIALGRLGINNSHITEANLVGLPEELQAQIRATADAEGIMRTPLYLSFQLLAAIAPESELARRYGEREKDLQKVLDQRNSSLLAHGFVPVDENSCNKLLGIVLDFLGMEQEQLPEFPRLDMASFLMN